MRRSGIAETLRQGEAQAGGGKNSLPRAQGHGPVEATLSRDMGNCWRARGQCRYCGLQTVCSEVSDGEQNGALVPILRCWSENCLHAGSELATGSARTPPSRSIIMSCFFLLGGSSIVSGTSVSILSPQHHKPFRVPTSATPGHPSVAQSSCLSSISMYKCVHMYKSMASFELWLDARPPPPGPWTITRPLVPSSACLLCPPLTTANRHILAADIKPLQAPPLSGRAPLSPEFLKHTLGWLRASTNRLCTLYSSPYRAQSTESAFTFRLNVLAVPLAVVGTTPHPLVG